MPDGYVRACNRRPCGAGNGCPLFQRKTQIKDRKSVDKRQKRWYNQRSEGEGVSAGRQPKRGTVRWKVLLSVQRRSSTGFFGKKGQVCFGRTRRVSPLQRKSARFGGNTGGTAPQASCFRMSEAFCLFQYYFRRDI